jgi:hypothetical protein
MYYVNKNADLTETQRKLIEDQLNSRAGRGFVKHNAKQKSVWQLRDKGYCKAEYAEINGVLFDLTVTIHATKFLPFGTEVDVKPVTSPLTSR